MLNAIFASYYKSEYWFDNLPATYFSKYRMYVWDMSALPFIFTCCENVDCYNYLHYKVTGKGYMVPNPSRAAASIYNFAPTSLTRLYREMYLSLYSVLTLSAGLFQFILQQIVVPGW